MVRKMPTRRSKVLRADRIKTHGNASAMCMGRLIKFGVRPEKIRLKWNAIETAPRLHQKMRCGIDISFILKIFIELCWSLNQNFRSHTYEKLRKFKFTTSTSVQDPNSLLCISDSKAFFCVEFQSTRMNFAFDVGH